MFKNRCYNGGNRHNFEARYSERLSNKWGGAKGQVDLRELVPVLKEFRDKEYIHDICTWCGKIITKGEK